MLSLKTRGFTSSETCLAIISYSRLRNWAAVRGAIHIVMARLDPQARTPRSITGTRSRTIEMPVARNAMASLSEDILPNPVKMPTNTAIGMVKVKTLGRIALTIAQISGIEAD